MGAKALTGIRPTGSPHLGNYVGMIRPALQISKQSETFYPIVDYHGLIDVRDPEELKGRTIEAAAVLLALGLDAEKDHLYRQSDIPEVFELSWILACLTPKGMLNRGHAYKSAAQENRAAGRPDDAGVNAGLFNYPVLMAADILIFGADIVPVGEDNRQHMEIAKDVIQKLNRDYGLALKVPEAIIEDHVSTITGLDGRSMSKSRRNVIPIFAELEELRSLVMRIVTDSKRPEDPKDPERCNVFALYRHFGEKLAVEDVRSRYIEGGIGYAEIKEMLVRALEDTFGEARERYKMLMETPAMIESIFDEAAARIRPSAVGTLAQVREAVGISSSAK